MEEWWGNSLGSVNCINCSTYVLPEEILRALPGERRARGIVGGARAAVEAVIGRIKMIAAFRVGRAHAFELRRRDRRVTFAEVKQHRADRHALEFFPQAAGVI